MFQLINDFLFVMAKSAITDFLFNIQTAILLMALFVVVVVGALSQESERIDVTEPYLNKLQP